MLATLSPVSLAPVNVDEIRGKGSPARPIFLPDAYQAYWNEGGGRMSKRANTTMGKKIVIEIP